MTCARSRQASNGTVQEATSRQRPTSMTSGLDLLIDMMVQHDSDSVQKKLTMFVLPSEGDTVDWPKLGSILKGPTCHLSIKICA